MLEAAAGNQAWALLRQYLPPLALLETRMIGRNGLEVTRASEADPGLVGTVVFLVSTTAQACDIEAGRQVGADDYITKPFSPTALAARVADVLRSDHGAAATVGAPLL